MNKRVIITGGTGFIGGRLARLLANCGYEVVVLTRDPSKVPPKGCTFTRWDGHSAFGWGGLVDGAFAIVNLAGESIAKGKFTPQKKKRILQSRLHAGRAVMEAIASANEKPSVLVQASAIGIYGNRGEEVLEEDSGIGVGFLAGVAKQWEESTKDAKEYGVRRCIIRTAVVVGEGGGFLEKLALPFKLFLGGKMGPGMQWMSWVHIEDQIRAIKFLLEEPKCEGEYNIASPSPQRNADFSRFLAKAMRRPSRLMYPAFLLRLVLGEVADELILTSQRAYPKRLTEAGFEFNNRDLLESLKRIFKK